MLELSVVYDNNQKRADLTSSWGFSSVIKTPDKSILFDTGADSTILLNNLEKMGLDPMEIQVIIISHNHSDHAGGLRGLLRINPNAHVYIPNSMIKKALSNQSNNIIPVTDYHEIFPKISVLNHKNTLALVLDGENGVFMAVSRIPSRAIEMMEKTRRLMKRNIHFILGGFCLHSPSEIAQIVNPLERLGVKKIVIGHCCGEMDKKILMERFSGDCIKAGVGSVIKV